MNEYEVLPGKEMSPCIVLADGFVTTEDRIVSFLIDGKTVAMFKDWVYVIKRFDD